MIIDGHCIEKCFMVEKNANAYLDKLPSWKIHTKFVKPIPLGDKITGDSRELCIALVREKIRYYTQLTLETKRDKLKSNTQQFNDVYDKLTEANLAKIKAYEEILEELGGQDGN